MKNIFTGFILIFLDFNLNLGNSQIGLIPDFVGYIIMISGLVEMGRESELFIKVKPYASGMAIYTGILYLLDLLGISSSLGVLSYVLALTSIAVSLYISYNIVMGVIDIERKYNTLFNGSRLKSTWNLLAIFNVLTFVLSLIPAVAIICIILTFIVTICFLVDFNKSKILYYNNNFI
jgi:hypothetical protein